MADVKPAEVSAILKNQLAGFESTASLDEVGTVLQVGDGIARVYGLTHAEYGELVTFENGMDGMVLNLEEDNVGVVLLGPSKEIKEGNTVKRTKKIASINVGEGIVGRVVDTLGTPIDGKGPRRRNLPNAFGKKSSGSNFQTASKRTPSNRNQVYRRHDPCGKRSKRIGDRRSTNGKNHRLYRYHPQSKRIF